jgi:hypothetical protein
MEFFQFAPDVFSCQFETAISMVDLGKRVTPQPARAHTMEDW